ncbi:glycosyltransferase family 2 protein [Croceicoccus sp. F390]|uniref:Glycosyltransferase family 2 protein n=1 Tax=Croceicoccus esteveae TaxID=3075597 RepID=A0ABU2ZK74_9SPHN|nr:glycosyltransferase family 2 protein [Croceicoccus sp. F390]MDT0576997.1 glycosyltransferase family 2 protein [Croceicoccus sp. F390]
MSTVEVSVVVCTRNRAESLARMLRSLAAMDVPADLAWEVVIVDNGSTDDTPAVIEGFADRLPIRRVMEAEPGLSVARNTGAANARGHYICWTDDDVEVGQEWLVAYLDAFAAFPDAAYFAGRVVPVYEGERPSWITRNMDVLATLFAERDLGGTRRALRAETNEGPFGANCAVVRKWQRDHPYNVELGVSPRFRRLGEETAVFRAIRAAGGQGCWVPAASVRHHIPQSRQTKDYVLTYQKSVGETWAALTDLGIPNFMGPELYRTGRLIRGSPAWLWRKTAQSFGAFQLARLAGNERSALKAMMKYAYYRGANDYLIRTRRNHR